MVPTLKIGRDKLISNGYINGYLADKRRDVQYKNAVYILFKPASLNMFREFLDAEYQRTKDVIDDYDYEEGYVVVVYKLNNKWKEDFLLIREGMYSKTSKEFQDTFPKVIKVVKNNLHRDEISLQYRIFNKTQDLREYWEDRLNVNFTDDMEVWDVLNIENETLNIDDIIKKQYDTVE